MDEPLHVMMADCAAARIHLVCAANVCSSGCQNIPLPVICAGACLLLFVTVITLRPWL